MTPERLLSHCARKRVPQSSHKICWVQADPLDANWWLGGFLGHDLTKFANQHFHIIYDVIKISDDCSCQTQIAKIDSFSLIFQKYQKSRHVLILKWAWFLLWFAEWVVVLLPKLFYFYAPLFSRDITPNSSLLIRYRINVSLYMNTSKIRILR